MIISESLPAQLGRHRVLTIAPGGPVGGIARQAIGKEVIGAAIADRHFKNAGSAVAAYFENVVLVVAKAVGGNARPIEGDPAAIQRSAFPLHHQPLKAQGDIQGAIESALNRARMQPLADVDIAVIKIIRNQLSGSVIFPQRISSGRGVNQSVSAKN